MEFDSYSKVPEPIYPKFGDDRPTRMFKCGFCDVTWKAHGFESECWGCGHRHVILTLNDVLET